MLLAFNAELPSLNQMKEVDSADVVQIKAMLGQTSLEEI